jgi:hypothetical protein
MGQDTGEVTVITGRTDGGRLSAPQDPGAYGGDKSPHEIQRDIALTRERLGTNIEALETKLSPHEIVRQGADALRSSFEGTGGLWAERIRANAIPLGIIAAGLALLLIPRSRRAQEEEAEGPSGTMGVLIEPQETEEAVDALTPPPMVPAGAESSDVEIVAAGGPGWREVAILETTASPDAGAEGEGGLGGGQEEAFGDHEREAAAEPFELAAAGDKPFLASAPPPLDTEASAAEERERGGAGSNKEPP